MKRCDYYLCVDYVDEPEPGQFQLCNSHEDYLEDYIEEDLEAHKFTSVGYLLSALNAKAYKNSIKIH